ncbi:MAG: GAK system XXXCH domain-containing protein [Proteobacteria bacterium]|nr:GAK system XXXCH domain-containing protein [Pseudomonadota bacterium]
MKHDTILGKLISREELPSFFRQLADALETGVADGEFVCVEDFAKLKISVSNDYGQLILKMKTSSREPCAPEAEIAPTPVDFKSLKKRMKASFGLIFKLLHAQRMPPKDAMTSFLADSARMITLPGHGDEDYPDYARACDGLAAAFATGDLEAVTQAAHEIASLKGHCHSRYA